MPEPNPELNAALQKLGEHLRKGWEKKHPVSDKSLESVRDAVREQYEQERPKPRDLEEVKRAFSRAARLDNDLDSDRSRDRGRDRENER
jgi:hypothetical protein